MKALDLFVSCEEDAEFTYYDDDGWSKSTRKAILQRQR